MIRALYLTLYAPTSLVLLVVAGTTLAWMLDSWRTPRAVGQMPFPPPDRPRLSFSSSCPPGTRRRCWPTRSAGCCCRTTPTSRC
ncbi:hypothetical protein ACFQZC_36995 [Streptacidiphilus monticola]